MTPSTIVSRIKISKADIAPSSLKAFSTLLALCLLGCSGGGGSSSTPSPTPTPPTSTDTTAPVIEISGFETVEIVVDGIYDDPGAVATDDQDGDISAQMVVTSNVFEDAVGTYQVAYNVSDSAGNAAAEVTRTVNVVPAEDKVQYGANGFVQITGGLNGFPDNVVDGGDRFGRDHAVAGDIDSDGILDMIIGARSDDDGATDAGAVYITFMRANGTVRDTQKISMLEGGFTETLNAGNFFGYGVAGIGDYDGDNIPDIAVTAPTQPNQALYILHLNADGTVKSYVKNSGIPGQGLSAAGDLNGDGKLDLIAAAPDTVGGGGIEIIFLDDTSQVVEASTIAINSIEGGFGTGLVEGDSFGGRESAVLGDLDGNGSIEVAVGAFETNGGVGAIWILSLDPNTFLVLDKLKITSGEAGFDEAISTDVNPNGSFGGQFGHALAAVGDLNGDGIPDLFTGANQHEEGHAFILYLNADKTVKTYTRINATEGGFNLDLLPTGRFSRSISAIIDPSDTTEITINVGGDADGSGGYYALNYQQCEFQIQGANTFWTGGTDLFTNWNHNDQAVSTPLTYEQCATEAFAVNGDKLTYSGIDRRCIIKDDNAVLADSSEGSVAYLRTCP